MKSLAFLLACTAVAVVVHFGDEYSYRQRVAHADAYPDCGKPSLLSRLDGWEHYSLNCREAEYVIARHVKGKP